MSICEPCKRAAEGKRKKHPKKCGCPCQHKPPGSWKGVKT